MKGIIVVLLFLILIGTAIAGDNSYNWVRPPYVISINISDINLTAKAPWLYLVGSEMNWNETKGNETYQNLSNSYGYTLDQAYDAGGNTIDVDTDYVIFNLSSHMNFEIQDEGDVVFRVRGGAIPSPVAQSVRWYPINDTLYDLGTSDRRWRSIYLSENLTDGTNSIIMNDDDYLNTISDSGFLWTNVAEEGLWFDFEDALFAPFDNDSLYDLGDSSLRWKDLYLSGVLSDGTNTVTVANAKTAYDYSQIGHLPLTGGTVTDHIYIEGSGKALYVVENKSTWTYYLVAGLNDSNAPILYGVPTLTLKDSSNEVTVANIFDKSENNDVQGNINMTDHNITDANLSESYGYTLDQAYDAGGNTINVDTDNVEWNVSIGKNFKVSIPGFGYWRIAQSIASIDLEIVADTVGKGAILSVEDLNGSVSIVAGTDGEIWADNNLLFYPGAVGDGFHPHDDNSYDLGNTSLRWRNIEAGGYLHVGTDARNITSIFVNAGDAYFGNRVVADGSISGWASPYGIALMALENDGDYNFTSEGGTADLNATTQYICDSTNPFASYHEKMWFSVISSTPDYADATGEITDFINSTCIRVSFASAGGDTIVDAVSMSYYVYPHPIAGFLDNGFISFSVGENPDTRFEIHIDNGTGFHGVYIEDTAGANSHQSLTVDTDIKNFDGIVAFNSYLFSSTGATDIHSDSLNLEIDETDINDSELHFIDMSIIGYGAGSGNEIDAISVDPNVNHIIHMGSTDTLDSAFYESTDVTANFINADSNIVIFSNDNEYIYIGNTLNFTTISVALDTGASASLNLEYYYCNSTYDWETLIGVSDTTNGFQVSGSISFINPSNRGTCNKEYDGTPFSDTSNYTYIALKRTRNFIVTAPIESLFTISGASTYFLLQKDMMNLNPTDTAPETCDASFLGAIYFDISEDSMCQCASGGWKVIHDNSECT